MRTLALLFVLATAPAQADGNPELEKASRLVFDQKFADAGKALEAAARVAGNPREAVLKLYELQGVVHTQLGQAAKARDAFQALLSLDPSHELVGKYNPKVLSAFAAAKEWAAANPGMEFKAAKAAVDDKGKVMQLAAKVKSDTLKLSRKVRFHLRPDDSRWSEQDSELQGAYAAASTEALGVEWWAELLGENDRVLLAVGTESNPVREGRAATAKSPPLPGAAEPPRNDEKVAAVEKPNVGAPVTDELRSAPAHAPGLLRPVGIALAGAGVVSLGIGAFFGVQSTNARAKIDGATKNAQGQVTSPNQKDSFALDAQARSSALVANVLMITGGVVAAAGGILLVVSLTGADAPTLAVVPAAGGVVVSGSF